jgi:hypothetical protein
VGPNCLAIFIEKFVTFGVSRDKFWPLKNSYWSIADIEMETLSVRNVDVVL